MTVKHPVDAIIARMSPRDQEIANQLYEAGYSDEDLYAALPNPEADRLLRQPMRDTKRKAASGVAHAFKASDESRNNVDGEKHA